MTEQIDQAIAFLRRILGEQRFRVRSEADLQEQVVKVLSAARLVVDREVISSSGRYDLQVRHGGCMIVVELKRNCAPAAVERQAQRYAMTHGVDAVVVATTSRRLAAKLSGLETLGGKPFAVIALRSW